MLASSGEITDPCPVPFSLTVTTPFSRTPAFNHFWIRRIMRRSPMRCEVEGLRFSEPASGSSFRREAAELDQAGLVRIERQRELLEPLAHIVPEAPGVRLVLEADDKSSRPGESHPQALTEPDVSVAAHPALIVQPLRREAQANGRRA